MRLADYQLSLTVWALGATQIIGYGTLYYSFSILAPEMAHDIGWSLKEVYGAFSAALLAGGLAAPVTGRLLDSQGAGRVMALGSAAAALSLAACAIAPAAPGFVAALIALQIASGLVQYNAAFALLVQIAPNRAQRTITHLTLIAGFASTLFWPLTSLLHDLMSWRTVYLLFSAANVAICLPIHWHLAHLMRQAPVATSASVLADAAVEEADAPVPPAGRTLPEGRLGEAERRRAFLLVVVGFTSMSFVLSTLLVHMVPMLVELGLGAAAVLVGTAFGPAQVLARFVNMLFGTGIGAARLASLSALALPLSLLVLLATAPALPGAILFAALFGAGSGINSIVQGTLPLDLFGSRGYATLVGRITAVRLVVAAAAPFVFAFLSERYGVQAALAVTAAVGTLAVFAFLAIPRRPAVRIVNP